MRKRTDGETDPPAINGHALSIGMNEFIADSPHKTETVATIQPVGADEGAQESNQFREYCQSQKRSFTMETDESKHIRAERHSRIRRDTKVSESERKSSLDAVR
jgi:hypothetical protein